MQDIRTVRLRAFGGEVAERAPVEVDGDMLVVCRPEQYEAAKRESREPNVLGFPADPIVADTDTTG